MKLHALSAAICAALLAFGPAAAQTQDQIDAARAEAAQYTDAELIALLRAAFEQVSPGRYQLLLDNFPDEVRALERRAVAESRAGRMNPAVGQSLGYAFIAELYATHGSAMGRAPADAVVKGLRAQLDTMVLLREVNLVACHELGETGLVSEQSATSLSDRVLKALAGFSDVQILTLVAGKRNPVDHGPLTRGDVDAIFSAYNRRGGDMRVMSALGTPDIAGFSPAERCNASISLIEAVLDQPPALIARFVAFSHNPTQDIPNAS